MLKEFFRNIRLPQSIFFIILVLTGVMVSGFYQMHSIIMKILLIFFLWEYTVVINRIYDERKYEKLHYSASLAFLSTSLILGLVLGPVFLALGMTYIIAGTVYSTPPLRLRKYMFGTAFIGIGSVIAFLIGYYENPSTPLTYEILNYCILLFLATSLGSTIKDMKDYEKDRKDGIKNIFTVFGLEKGKKISSALLLVTFLIPSLVFNLPIDISFFVIMGVLSVAVFIKFEDFRPVMVLAFLVLLYCVLRLKGIV